MKPVITVASLVAVLLTPTIGSALDRNEAVEIARRAISSDPASFGLTEDVLAPGRARTSTHMDQRIIRFDVERDGLPVFFESIVVQVSDDGAVLRSSGATVDGTLDHALVHPGEDCVAAMEWAEVEGLSVSMLKPGWLDTPRGLRPVIRVDHVPANPAAAVSIFLDAETVTPIHEEPMVDHADALGAVFRENPVTTPEVILVGLDPLDDSGDRLYGAHARVEKCVDTEECEETEVNAAPDADGNFINDPDLDPFTTDDQFCEVNVYNNISSINRWARETFGWEETFLGETWILVKVGIAWYNAAYYGGNDETAPFIIFGQDEIDLGYDADVAFHEFGHAINRSLRNHPWFVRDELGLDTAPSGIEEGMADIWATHFSGDPVMNSYVLPSRSADNSTTCPEDLMGEGHMEALIVSAMGWDVRERIGPEAWGQIIYRTLFFLDAEAGFDEFVKELARSADDLSLEAGSAVDPDHGQIILEEGEARGLLLDECSDRIVPLREGEPRRAYGYGRERTNHRDRPFGVQWRAIADGYTASFNLALRWRYPDDVEPGYRLHISRGAPVKVTWLDPSDVEEGDPEFEVAADLTMEGSPESVSFPVMGQDPLEPGEEVFFLLSADTEEQIVVVDVESHALSQLPPPTEQPQEPAEGWKTAHSWNPSCSLGISEAAAPPSGFPRLISLLL